MGISRFNSEGYYDPVPHEALSKVKKETRAWKPLVYVASPFAGDEARNAENAARYCRFAVDSGAIPWHRTCSCRASCRKRRREMKPCL